MQLINKTKRCSACNCLSFPDAKLCPKCGKQYFEEKTKVPSKLLSNNTQLDNKITEVFIDYDERELVTLCQKITISII